MVVLLEAGLTIERRLAAIFAAARAMPTVFTVHVKNPGRTVALGQKPQLRQQLKCYRPPSW
jgi:hypothetical protein